MTTKEFEGYIDESGELRIDQPTGFHPGKVKVMITQLESEDVVLPWGQKIVAMLTADVDTGGWAEMDIPDVVDWLKEQRRDEMARRQSHWDHET